MVSSSLPRFSKWMGSEIFLQLQELSQQRHGQDQGGDTAEDRAGDEVRAEDRGVPHGHRVMAKSQETMVCTETATGMMTMAMMCMAISRRCHCRGVPCHPSANTR
jgi:hypothetical protein